MSDIQHTHKLPQVPTITAELYVKVAGALALLIGLGGLLASALGALPFLRGWSGSPALICDTALGFSIAGLGLFFGLQQHSAGCRAVGIAVASLGALHLFSNGNLLPARLFSDKTASLLAQSGSTLQMAQTTGVVFLLVGLAFLLLSLRSPSTPQLWCIALAGTSSTSLGCFSLLAQFAGIGAGHWWISLLGGQSLPATVGSCAVGTALCCLFWIHVRLRHHSVVIVIAALSLTSMLLLFAGADTTVVLSADAVMQSRIGIAESFRKIKQMQGLVEAVRTAETGQRGYLLTGNSRYLENYAVGSTNVRALLAQTRYSARLGQLVRQKMTELDRTIQSEKVGHHEDALRIVRTNEGLLLMKAIEEQASAEIRSLRIELDKRNESGRLSSRLVQKTVALSYVVALVLTGLALYLVAQELRRNAQQQKALRESEASLERRVQERTEDLTFEIAHRQRTEERLRKAEGRYQSALASSKVATWTWTPVDDTVLWAGPVEQIFGCEPSELSSYLAFRTMIHPDDRDRIDKALIAGNGYEAEFRIIRSDGQVRWIAGRGDTVFDGAQIARLTGVNFDITDRKLAEEACKQSESTLREQDRQLAMVFDNGVIGNWSYDIGRNLLVAHPTVWRLYGAEPQAGAPWSWFAKRHHPDDHGKILAAFRSALRGKSNPDIEFRALWPDGSLRWLSCRGNVTLNDAGTPVQVSGLIIDMTERKVNELELKRREENFRNLANAMPQIVWTAHPDGTVDFYNERWYDLTGIEHGQTGDNSWRPLLHPEDLSSCISTWYASLQTGKPFEMQLRFWDYKRSTYRWYLSRAMPNRDPHDRIVSWFGTCTDIHRQKAAEEILEAEVQDRTKELRELLLEKETLLKELHHRVKNNLQVISSLLRMQSETVPEGEARTALNESRQRVFSMALIHERLYAAEQMSELDFGPYAKTLVNELVYSYSRTGNISARINVSSIRLNIDQAIPCGLILNELITNAMKYAYPDERAGEINVDFRESAPNRLCLTVSDNGIGLPVDFNWKKSKSLGMSIVDVLAHQLSGKFSIQTQPGATFIIEFPKDDLQDSLAA